MTPERSSLDTEWLVCLQLAYHEFTDGFVTEPDAVNILTLSVSGNSGVNT